MPREKIHYDFKPYSQKWFEHSAKILSFLHNEGAVDNVTGCIISTSLTPCDRGGYAKLYVCNTQWRIHRLSHVVANRFSAPEKFKNLDVGHTCGNRACFAPEHLFWQDKKRKRL